MVIRQHVKEINKQDILFSIINLVNNSYLFMLTPENFIRPETVESSTNILTKNILMNRNEEKDTGPKFYANFVKIRPEYEKKAMITELEIDKLVKECHIQPDILKLVARGIKSDVVCRTYLSFDQLKKTLLTNTVEGTGYKDIAMHIYKDGYELFKQRIIYEFQTLESVFKDITNQFPSTKDAKAKKMHRFRVNNTWKQQMERNIDLSKIEEMMENNDQYDKQKETYKNVLDEKALKDKFPSSFCTIGQ